MLVVGSGLGLAAAWRRWHHRRRPGGELSAHTGAHPAEELRAKLAASRATAVAEPPAAAEPVEPQRAEPQPAGEDVAAERDAAPLDPQSRRRSVHEGARASIDELR